MKCFAYCSLTLFAASGALIAGSATWNLNPTSNDWNTAVNWTPATVPNDPADTATFEISNIPAVSQAGVIDVGEIVFNPGASAFTIKVTGTLSLDGAGITNNSGVVQNFAAPGFGASITFYNSATAGEDTVFAQGAGPSDDIIQIAFYGNSSAGSATFINQGNDEIGSGTRFYENSTAAHATIFNLSGGPTHTRGGETLFSDAATAGSATLIANGGVYGEGTIFFDNISSADHASITLNGATVTNGTWVGELNFEDHSSAANATVVANGGTASGAYGSYILFDGNPSAGNARFIVNGGTNGGRGATLHAYNNAPGGAAQLELFYSGTLDLNQHSQDTPFKLGSIAGNGLAQLGNTNLIVGANNFTTAFSGLISSGGLGSLTKTGSGNLALLAPNTYQGGTVVQGTGFLFVNNLTGSGTGTGTVQVNSGGLAGNGIVSGALVIGDGSGDSARFKPGENVRTPGVLTIGQSLTFNADASYVWLLDPVRVIASSVATPNVTINSAALFSPAELGSGTLSAGTVFTVINNSGTAPIAGRFGNLPDGGTISVGSSTFQANYEGGNGNDLTLTVVP